MSDNSANRSSAWLWWVLSLAVAVVLYMLGIGVTACLIGAGRMKSPYPPWMRTYWKPWSLLADHTPLRDPMMNYVGWWVDRGVEQASAGAPKP